MFTLLFASTASLLSPESGHDHAPQLGSLSFESSCKPETHAQLERGLGWLHSFEYAEAERRFTEAAQSDPDCAIAYWGIAMSNYHPLWAPPNTQELERGRSAVAQARKARTKSPREQDYIEAIAAFYDESDRLDHKTRALAYSAAMERLHNNYAGDHEAAVFYALSLIAEGTMDDDPMFAKEKAAGAILNRVLAIEPDHPGVAHYLIHSFDYPALAELALPAARRYAAIAPSSPHAQHMPSHIFVRLGLWDEAIKSNVESESAARVLAKAQGLPDSSSERLHAMDYLAYGYLQTGQDRKAEEVLRSLNGIQRADPPVFSVAYAATAIPARLVLERRKWSEAASLALPDNVRQLAPLETYKWGAAHIHFARAIGAARSGNAAAAKAEVERLREIEMAMIVPAGTYDWKTQVSIERQVAEAWLANAEGRKEEALRLMRAAAELDDATEKHPVTPGAILPAREQLGELLLEIGQPSEALSAFEASLTRAPRRLAGLYGAARAARQSGDVAKAQRYFADIAELTKEGDGDRAEIRDARAFAAKVATR